MHSESRFSAGSTCIRSSWAPTPLEGPHSTGHHHLLCRPNTSSYCLLDVKNVKYVDVEYSAHSKGDSLSFSSTLYRRIVIFLLGILRRNCSSLSSYLPPNFCAASYTCITACYLYHFYSSWTFFKSTFK